MNNSIESQITTSLPREEIFKVPVHESGEPLVEIIENDKIKLLKEHAFLSPYIREGVLDVLIRASNNLPLNHKLLIVTAYRPISMQKKLWRNRLIQMAKRHPFKMIFRYKEWVNLASKYTAPPGGSSHQCGAAVDVTILDQNNERLDMGTSFTDFGSIVNTHTDLITEKQKQNRRMLYEVMTKAGFVNYPLEWWHYSYGDRMWAAYGRKTHALYGRIEE